VELYHDTASWPEDYWPSMSPGVAGTIVVHYDGELEREFVDYLVERDVKVLETRPLVLSSGNVDDLLQRILGFLAPAEVRVRAISVRRHPGRRVA